MDRAPEKPGIEFSNPGTVFSTGDNEIYNDLDFADLILEVVRCSQDAGDILTPVGADDGSFMEPTRQDLLNFVNGEQPLGFIDDSEIPAILGMCRNALEKKLKDDRAIPESDYSYLPGRLLAMLIGILEGYERHVNTAA